MSQAETDPPPWGESSQPGEQAEQPAPAEQKVLSPDLRDELTRLRAGWTERGGASQAELRIEQAQLVGWLEGILQGIHNALAQEQGAAQEGSGQMPAQQGFGQQASGQQRTDHHGPGQPGAGQLGSGFG